VPELGVRLHLAIPDNAACPVVEALDERASVTLTAVLIFTSAVLHQASVTKRSGRLTSLSIVCVAVPWEGTSQPIPVLSLVEKQPLEQLGEREGDDGTAADDSVAIPKTVVAPS